MRVFQIHRRVAVWLAMLSVPLASAILYSRIPPNPDQMELNYAGWRMLYGERPYVDLMSCNWPGTLWMHMGAIAVFGNTLSAWRSLDALLMLATVAGVAWFFRSALDSLTAGVVVVFYPVLCYAGGWLTGQRDFVAAHLMLLAAAFHWKAWQSANWPWQIGTGLCIGYAALIKPPYLLALPALIFAGSMAGRSLGLAPSVRLKQAAAAILAAMIVLALMPLFLIGEGTPLWNFWEMGVDFHLQAYSQEKMPFGDRVWNLSKWIVGPWWWVSGLAALFPLWFVRRAKPPQAGRHAFLVIVCILMVCVVSYLWQGQGLMYHASGIYVCLLLLALIAVAALTRLVVTGPALARIGSSLLLVCFLLAVSSRIRTYYLPPLNYLTGRLSAKDFYSQFTAGRLTVWEALAFAGKIREAGSKVTDADKSILVWSLANVVNNESGYRNATRFYTPPVLLLARPPFPQALAWRHQFEVDVERANPFACVVEDEAARDRDDEAVKFVRRLVHDRYRPIAATAHVTLYLRRDGK